MYAIIANDGRQYKVKEGRTFLIDYLEGAEEGATLTFDQVLAISTGDEFELGAPLVGGASVTAEVLGMEKGEKLVIQKFRRRKNHRNKTGHRQKYTAIRVTKIASALADRFDRSSEKSAATSNA